MEIKNFDYLPDDAVFVRTTVFIEEQGFENELDGYEVEEPEMDDYFGADLFGSDEESYDDSDEI